MVYLWGIALFIFILTAPTHIEKDRQNERTQQEKITNVEVSDKTAKVPEPRKMGVDDSDFSVDHSSRFHLLDLD